MSEFLVATLTNTMREVCLIVQTIADVLDEPPETFTVSLGSSDPSVTIGRSNSTGTIRNASKSDLPSQEVPFMQLRVVCEACGCIGMFILMTVL